MKVMLFQIKKIVSIIEYLINYIIRFLFLKYFYNIIINIEY
jgi:hypothetical protein